MSQALLARPGRTLFVSGQVARDEGGRLVGQGDFAAQARFALGRVLELVCAAGGDPSDLARLRCYLVDRTHIKDLVAVRREMLAAPYPAVTTILVAGLADPLWLLEIEATAVLGG